MPASASSPASLYADVAANAGRPSREAFTYAVPAALSLRLGQGVFVPFGRRMVQGVVLALRDGSAIADPRPIHGVIEPEPFLTPAQAALARWIASAYLAPLYACVALFLPRPMSQPVRRVVAVLPEASESAAAGLTERQRRILSDIAARGSVDAARLEQDLDDGRLAAALDALVAAGLLSERYELAPEPAPRRLEPLLALAVSPHEAEAAASTWPRSKRSRKADLLERLQVGPAPLEEARRLAGSRDSLRRWLDDAALVARDGDTSVRLARRLGNDPAASDAAVASLRRSAAERRSVALLDALLAGPRPDREVRAEAGAGPADVEALVERGLVRRQMAPQPARGGIGPPTAPVLTADQARAYRALADALNERLGHPGATRRPRLFLLKGVTGSGKTEVYLAAAERVRKQGGVTIVLVPEIALAPQTIDRFRARLAGRIAVLHSGLSAGEAAAQRRRIRAGDVDVVIGSRSALFAPVREPALIIVDEEHEWTYKQTNPAPRYHVREVVERYCTLTGAVAVLGSATPDLVTASRAQAGQYTRLDLEQRVRRPERSGIPPPRVPLPAVEVVDLREELKSGNRSIFSRPLQSALEDTLGAGAQAMLFLNRRGAGIVVCRTCGEAVECERCSIPLTYHEFPAAQFGGSTPAGVLRCHECGRRAAPPGRCPRCESSRIRPMGMGTERLEEEVARAFPLARPLRWDRDTARGPQGHRRLLERFRGGEANVLVGTQMIAKGLDLPQVTLVGVINADLALRLPDYTGPERTFQLIAQVAGRSGRGAEGGRVIVQSYAPDHHAIVAAAGHDYDAFFAGEIRARAAHDYPPSGRLARLIFTDRTVERAREVAAAMAASLIEDRDRRGLPGPAVLGPTPAFISKRRGAYRQQITLRGADPLPLLRPIDFPRGWTVDIDPVSLL